MNGRGLREGRHVRGRDDAVVDRDALVHVGEVVLLQPQLAVAVEHEVDRLAVVLLDQLLELQQRLVEGVVVVELDRAVQGDRLLGVARRRNDGNDGDRSGEERRPWRAEHCILPRSRVLVVSIVRRLRSLSMDSWRGSTVRDVGRIYETRGGPDDLRWFWSMTVNGPMTRSDRVATLEEAKAQFRKSWDAWKAWASLEERGGLSSAVPSPSPS